VLIVDAYRHSREGLKTSLQIEGCVVATAATSWEAISQIKDGRFDLAIVDLELPPAHGVNMTGWELVQVFRAFQAGAPVVLVTADWQPAFLERTQQIEGVHVVEKPVSTAELRSIVRRLRQDPSPGPRRDSKQSGRR
jgi:CheY-like chemotaxis protein